MVQHLRAVWQFRHFWLSLVRMDLRQRYRRSVLGIGWSVLHPIAMSAVFCLVFSQIMNMSMEEHLKLGYSAGWRAYAAFLLTGLAVWDFVRNSTTSGCTTLLHNESYIRQCPLPYGIYPLRTVMGTGVHFLISMAVVVVLVAVLRQSLDVFGVLWAVVPVMALLFCFCWAMATLTGFATVYFHDTSHLCDVGAQLFFFLTPIMYTRDVLEKKGIGFVADLNPVYTLIELVRQPILSGGTVWPPAHNYGLAVGITAAAVGLAFGTIAWLQKKVIFHM